MKPTTTQLECMKLGADKVLSFGCQLLRHYKDGSTKIYYIIGPGRYSRLWISSMPFGSMDLEFDEDMISKSSGDWYEIIGHPITRGRLCYLAQINYKAMGKILVLQNKFINSPELYNQTILEWDEHTINLVREFLLSIQ